MTEFALEPPSPGRSSLPAPDRHSKDILTPLSLDTRSSSSPFPSPSSSFVPPPMPGAHEFANRPPIGRMMRNKKLGSPNNMHEDPESKKIHEPDLESSKLLNGTVPNLDTDATNASPGVAVTPVTPTPASIMMSPVSSTSRVLPMSPTVSESMAGYDTPTQIQITLPPPPASPTHAFSATVPTLVRTPSGSGIASKHTSLSSSRPAPPSPAPSRRQSGVPSLRSRHRSGLSSVSVSSSKFGTVKGPSFVVSRSHGEIKIRDFAFPPVDARHTGRGPDTPKVIKRLLKRHGPAAGSGSRRASGVSESSLESEEGGSRRSSGFSGWGTFRWASKLGNAWGFGGGNGTNRASISGGYTPSQLDFERNFDDGTEHEPTDAAAADIDDGDYLSDDYDDDGEDEAESEELLPGLYRALYDFDPEGTAEMGLKEGQTIRVVGRGGGVGWAIAVRPDAEGKDEGSEVNWALVPESYLKAVRLDDIKPEREGGPSLGDARESGEQMG